MINTQSTMPLLLFAKAPIAGKVKTRLQPSCNPLQAAEIAKILLEQSILKATSCWDGAVLLSVWLDKHNEFIHTMVNRYPIRLVSQARGNLGDKMLSAFECHGFPAAIMGCDAPHVTTKTLRDTFANLVAGKNVLGASTDGGYYLIGLTSACPSLFEGIQWGSDRVLDATIDKAQQQAIKFASLPILNDVDTWQDLLQAAEQLPALRAYISGQGLI